MTSFSFALAPPRTRRWCAALAFALSLLSLPAAGRAAAALILGVGESIEQVLVLEAQRHPTDRVRVVVGERNPADDSLERAVTEGGGRVGRPLPIVDGFSAEIPAGLVPTLSQNHNLRSLSLDRVGKFEAISWDETNVASSTPKSTGATKLWAQGNYGGAVGVAVIDTGISPMNDFVKSGYRIVHGPDLSGEYSLLDTYGHGTVMASIIAGDGYDSAGQAGGAHVGMAPGAWLVSVKVAGANGATDVSTVLAAMHWVAAYRDQYNIRVVNLSWGTHGTQSYRYDPLNYGVERLWQLGITVVVAAGNSGRQAGTITKPGDDPFVITAGAYNDKQNTDLLDDNIPEWSSRGPTTADALAKPDVVAPGRYIIASRSYGSTVEKNYPKALYDPSYIRSSGTSQAAAATSGAAALLIRQKPHLSPAQVKYLLMSTARPIPGYTPYDQGAGRIDLPAAAASTDERYTNLDTPPSNGLGSLEASRGGAHVQTDCNGDGVLEVIQGEITVQCQPWQGTSWTGSSWTGTSWTGTSWTGSSWTNGTWDGTSWTGTSWTGTSWTGTSWTAGSWTGTSWTGTSWTAGSWTGTSWTTTNFTGTSWTGTSWTGTSWTAGSWTGSSWTGSSWTGTSWTGGSWTGSSWTGTSWTGSSWTGSSWTGSSWTTGSYDEFTTSTYDEFLTAFWGNRPKWYQHVAGEVSEPPPGQARRAA